MSVGVMATFQTANVNFSMKKASRLNIAGFISSFDTNCLCTLPFSIILLYGPAWFISVVSKNVVKTPVFFKFDSVDVILMVSKMFRGHLTAGGLAIGVTVVFDFGD